MNTFVNNVMNNLIGTNHTNVNGINIFTQLREHINDQCFSDNHVNHLLRLIIQLYSKTRLTHYVQNVRISDRHKLSKLILFKGQ